MAIAVLGGGCFWCLEAAFAGLRGVRSVVSGYSGGHVANPDYATVCSGQSGHAEVVQIDFNPDEISYRQLLEVFFTIHDPTTRDRQGNDVGPQYRSVIFAVDAGQREEAQQMLTRLAEAFPAPLVTQISELAQFYPAEPEHQNYYANHPEQGYCAFVVAPKLVKLRQYHSDLLR